VRRIALIADVHANLRALDAVFADPAGEGITESYCLGDLVGYGPDPAMVIARIRERGIPTVRGNYDDGIGNHRGDCGCYYDSEEARTNGRASYDFTDAALSDADHAWLAALPDSLRLDERGARLLLTHGSPRRLNEYLLPDRPDHQLERLAREAEADVVCVGHIHMPYHRVVAPGIHYVSVPSVGKPKDGDPRAGWTELLLGEEAEVAEAGDPNASRAGETDVWVAAIVHRVPYDVEGAAAAVLAAGLPPHFAEALRRG